MRFLEVIHPVRSEDLPRILDVWEASVRAAPGVVSEAYIQFFKPLARDELLRLVDLASIRDDSGEIVGFVGVADEKIEALFVHPAQRRSGVGRRLANYAVSRGATSVDVDEQNEAAVRFFRVLGFEIAARSDVDAMGKAFPVLHMRVPTADPRRPC
jgi:putative acetyltransferase